MFFRYESNELLLDLKQLCVDLLYGFDPYCDSKTGVQILLSLVDF